YFAVCRFQADEPPVSLSGRLFPQHPCPCTFLSLCIPVPVHSCPCAFLSLYIPVPQHLSLAAFSLPAQRRCSPWHTWPFPGPPCVHAFRVILLGAARH